MLEVVGAMSDGHDRGAQRSEQQRYRSDGLCDEKEDGAWAARVLFLARGGREVVGGSGEEGWGRVAREEEVGRGLCCDQPRGHRRGREEGGGEEGEEEERHGRERCGEGREVRMGCGSDKANACGGLGLPPAFTHRRATRHDRLRPWRHEWSCAAECNQSAHEDNNLTAWRWKLTQVLHPRARIVSPDR